MQVGIVGGTGALGRGLARRWALAGVDVLVGSRDANRARAAAEQLAEELADELDEAGGRLDGVDNLDAATAEVVVLAVPWDGLDAVLAPLTEALAGRVVVSAINPLAFDAAGPHNTPVAEGSVAEAIAARLPGARLTAAFHSVSSRELNRLEHPLDDDVPVVGDDEEAVATVVDLAGRIDGVRAYAAGPLRLSAPLEQLTALIISINKRHRGHAGLRFTRLTPR
ncbi:NADPH-dependent F420 reductase [Egicoccus halophilus]|uniref:NADPH-dependent F420 reductase n=1 Tax=Egicoccus halophilus TaxID=1670830 RepID=A0A8J3EV07_9ACTN|nr:NADPH-dependent F420 reductase [Egicoccus halophilus]GGI08230.1 NADPH-dependent F420 reductase [Egicoccus halophilus]